MNYLRLVVCPHSRAWVGTFLPIYAVLLLWDLPSNPVLRVVQLVGTLLVTLVIAPFLSYLAYAFRLIWAINRDDNPFPDSSTQASGPSNLAPTKYTEKEPRNV